MSIPREEKAKKFDFLNFLFYNGSMKKSEVVQKLEGKVEDLEQKVASLERVFDIMHKHVREIPKVFKESYVCSFDSDEAPLGAKKGKVKKGETPFLPDT